MSDFITTADVLRLSGVAYTAADQTRIETLIPLVCDALRLEGRKVGIDLDAAIETDTAYASVVKLVTADVVVRIMRQKLTGDPITQQSQSALGYSWSGTYAIPGGGGIASAIMRNDLKRLGFKRQRIGVIDLCPRPICPSATSGAQA